MLDSTRETDGSETVSGCSTANAMNPTPLTAEERRRLKWLSEFLTPERIEPGAITGAHIAAGAIDQRHLAVNAIGSPQIAP